MAADPDLGSMVSVDTVLAVLDLIVSDDVSGSSIHAALAGEDLTTDAAARIEEQADHVRTTFRRWRRREQELSAILSGVRELVELRDVDELLARLVDRARGLLGADVAYLTGHHNNALRVRTTSGVVAPELRELVVPVGMGLASRVVTHRSPQWTTSYQENEEIPHDPDIDRAVAAEGLKSLLGVPLLAGTEVLGALFAANRSTYEFSPDEIALLGAFADHAAVVLQTARLLDATQSAAEAAREATTVLSQNLAATERSSRVHEDLTSVVVSGGSAQEIAATLSSSLGRRVVVLDRHLSPIADAPSADGASGVARGARSAAVHTAIDQSRHSGLCVPVDGPGEGCEFVVAVVTADAILGALLLGSGDLEFGAVERRTVERAAQIMALVTLKQDAIIAAENRVSDELLSDVLNPRTPNNEAIIARARNRGIHLDQVRSAVALRLPDDLHHRSLNVLRQMTSTVLAGEEGDLLVALTTEEDPVAAADLTRQHLCGHSIAPVLAVGGPPAETVDDVGDSFETARRCAALLDGLGRIDGVVDVRAYAPYLAMFGDDATTLTDFIDVAIGPVLTWDAERGSELLITLHAFIEAQSSPTRTARRLHVHVNTVLQRLDRIATLLGADWREPEPLFRITVAVRLHTLARAT
ncbi:helix-turn-helix domain-containing protein [Janibacter cremeus]|uniref:helix-turn-helix domain-containing protein n=1 Tax=Janibacter cremeus TaxID=1285192 RepID=UPI0023F8CA4F|nr:helix-turn-helix domain-containing protein [Janibacter cremeus]WEV78786.1 helix-turn-helix domain-containing protein [Janibacter cremeus]